MSWESATMYCTIAFPTHAENTALEEDELHEARDTERDVHKYLRRARAQQTPVVRFLATEHRESGREQDPTRDGSAERCELREEEKECGGLDAVEGALWPK